MNTRTNVEEFDKSLAAAKEREVAILLLIAGEIDRYFTLPLE